MIDVNIIKNLKYAIKRNPYDPNKGNKAAYARYLRYNVNGLYEMENKKVVEMWENAEVSE